MTAIDERPPTQPDAIQGRSSDYAMRGSTQSAFELISYARLTMAEKLSMEKEHRGESR